jgi:hypothetical protein
MAFPVRLLALTAATLVAFTTQAFAALDANDVIKKARTAIAKDTGFLDRVTSIHYEGKVIEPDGKVGQSFIIEIAAGGKRRELRYDKEFTIEISVVSNGLEAWTRRSELTTGQSDSAKPLPHEIAQRLSDMARSDLAFFKGPDGGKVTLKETTNVEGRKVHSLEYSYKSGYKSVRHFDAESFALVATDIPQTDGTFQRQVEEETMLVDGVRIAKKVSIRQEGKVAGSFVFDKVIINGDINQDSFTFPVR